MHHTSSALTVAIAAKGLLSNAVGVVAAVLFSFSDEIGKVAVGCAALMAREVTGICVRYMRRKMGIRPTEFLGGSPGKNRPRRLRGQQHKKGKIVS